MGEEKKLNKLYDLLGTNKEEKSNKGLTPVPKLNGYNETNQEFANYKHETKLNNNYEKSHPLHNLFGKRAELEEKVKNFGDVVEKVMSIVLKIPDLVDQSVNNIYTRLEAVDNQITGLENEIKNVQNKNYTSGNANNTTPTLPRPPPGSGIKPIQPKPQKSLRGQIMDELKELFQNKQKREGKKE